MLDDVALLEQDALRRFTPRGLAPHAELELHAAMLVDDAEYRGQHVSSNSEVSRRIAATVTMGNSEESVWTRQLPRWSGVAAILGGLLLILAAILHSLEPSGCIGQECETREMRVATGTVPIVAPAAGLLILIGISGLTVMTRRSGRFMKLANAGVISAAVGVAILLLGALVQTVFYGGDFPWMPIPVILGGLGVIAGFILIGVFILRSGFLPRWLGIFLGVSAVLLLAANEQTVAVLLAIPFGLAVATVGFFMVTSGNADTPAARLQAD